MLTEETVSLISDDKKDGCVIIVEASVMMMVFMRRLM